MAGQAVPNPYPLGCWMAYLMLPNFAVMCARVEVHFRTLIPTNAKTAKSPMPRESSLFFLIRLLLNNASATRPPIHAVLESVKIIAKIQSTIMPTFTTDFLVLIHCHAF